MGTALSDDELQRLLDFAEYEKAELEASKAPGIFTPEELAEQAIEQSGLESHEHKVKCPKCGGTNVQLLETIGRGKAGIATCPMGGQ